MDERLWLQLASFEPHGAGNSRPVFAAEITPAGPFRELGLSGRRPRAASRGRPRRHFVAAGAGAAALRREALLRALPAGAQPRRTFRSGDRRGAQPLRRRADRSWHEVRPAASRGMRRRWELAVLAFGVLFLLLLAISFRPGRRPSKTTSQETMPRVEPGAEAGQPTTVLKGFDYTETVRGQPLFRIQVGAYRRVRARRRPRPERLRAERRSRSISIPSTERRSSSVPTEPSTISAPSRRASRATFAGRTSRALRARRTAWSSIPPARVLTAPENSSRSRDVWSRRAIGQVRRRRPRGPSGRSHPRLRHRGGHRRTDGLSADSAVYRRDQSIIELTGSVSGRSKVGD